MLAVLTAALLTAAAGPGLSLATSEPAEIVSVQRHNTGARHEEGIKHITPGLRAEASHSNSVDEALHEFLSAKFCNRLREAGLLDNPLVAQELSNNEILDARSVQGMMSLYASCVRFSCKALGNRCVMFRPR